MSELNPLTLGDMPEDFIENEDGSVDVILDEPIVQVNDEFLVNLAEVFASETLSDISADLPELISRDAEARKKRDEQYEEGLRRTGLGNDAPGGAEFDGASRVVHPVLAEACIDFSARAIKELFPSSGPVKPWVTAETDPKKLERANRKTRYMNWQLTTQIEEYRAELEQLLTQLPMGGSQYQKFWRDSRKKRTCCEFVPVDEILLPFSATCFYTAQRVTHRQPVTRAEFNRRVSSGLYRDVYIPDTNSAPEETLAEQANDKIEGREESGYNEDGVRYVLEIYTWMEFQEDDITQGDYAPYIITIDEYTEEVLAIYRNWDEQDTTFQKLDWIVEWKFIPWRGAYAIGLPHLIGGLAAALTGALRAVLDTAHINNAPTMLKLKAGRIVGQNTQVNVTQIHEIEGPAGIDDIRKLAMAMPFPPPSPVLIDLLDKLYGLSKNVVQTAEDKIGQVGDRTPVGTTMAMIEQGSHTYSAIHSRLHESQKKALSIIHRLDSKYLDDEEQVPDLGGLVVSREDFTGSMDVIPVSDPTIFSEAQRFAQSQAILQMAQGDAQNPNVPWNQVGVRRRILKQMRIDNIDELLPPEKHPITADILTENTQGMEGVPLKTSPEQSHMAHIQGHLAFVQSPVQLANPLAPPQAITAILGHIQEHIRVYSAQVTREMAKQVMLTGQFTNEDELLAVAIPQTQNLLTQQLAPVFQAIGQIQQQLQQRAPKPPMPPEVQASLQIAEMDSKRKAEYDKGLLGIKQTELQQSSQLEAAKQAATQQAEQVRMQLEAAQSRFEQIIEQSRLALEQQRMESNSQVELLKNQMDNHQKQMTELLKNRDDNETKLVIEQLTARMNEITRPQEPETNIAPQLQQLTQMLDQMSKQQTNEALMEVMNALRATVEHLGSPKPKMFIKDAQGKTIGIQ